MSRVLWKIFILSSILLVTVHSSLLYSRSGGYTKAWSICCLTVTGVWLWHRILLCLLKVSIASPFLLFTSFAYLVWILDTLFSSSPRFHLFRRETFRFYRCLFLGFFVWLCLVVLSLSFAGFFACCDVSYVVCVLEVQIKGAACWID